MLHCGVLSKVLTVSRLLAIGKCQRGDYLRTADLLAVVAVETEAEPLVRGSVIHAGLEVAVRDFPAPVTPLALARACAREAVARGLAATDARIAAWTRIALRAARAIDWAEWEPVTLPSPPGFPVGLVAGFSRAVRGDPTSPDDDAATGRLGAPGVSGDSGDVLVESRLGVALPDGPATWGDVGRGWVFSFKPDAVLRHIRTGRVWLWDHKTKGSIARVDPWTDLHMQTLLYVGALRRLGVVVDGAVLYTILADEPTVPTLRKDGHLKETAWATDWPTACEAIARSADPDPESPRYDKLRHACSARVWQLSQEVLFDDAELESAWDHLLACRDELVLAHLRAAELAAYRHGPVWRATHPSGRGVACATCDYREWCAEDFAGRDAEALIGDKFRRGASKYLVEVGLTRARTGLDYERPGELDGIERQRARP